MEIIKALKERSHSRKEAELQQQASDYITVTDFEDTLYIAYNDIPLAPIDPSWTTKEIVQQLSVFRTNFINSMMQKR